jgi:hypothetical protein
MPQAGARSDFDCLLGPARHAAGPHRVTRTWSMPWRKSRGSNPRQMFFVLTGLGGLRVRERSRRMSRQPHKRSHCAATRAGAGDHPAAPKPRGGGSNPRQSSSTALLAPRRTGRGRLCARQLDQPEGRPRADRGVAPLCPWRGVRRAADAGIGLGSVGLPSRFRVCLRRFDTFGGRTCTHCGWCQPSRRHGPTAGGILLFGANREQHFPGAWIQAGRFRGIDKSQLRRASLPAASHLASARLRLRLARQLRLLATK